MAARSDDLDALFRSMADRPAPPADNRMAGLHRLRVGVPNRYFNERMQATIAGAYEQALRAFQSHGCTVDEVTLPPIADAVQDAFTLAQVEAAHAHRARIPGRLAELGEDASAFLRMGGRVAALDYVGAVKRQTEFRAAMDRCFATVDVLIVPATPALPQPIGASQVSIGNETEPLFDCMIRYTCVFNVSGHPALAVPCPVDADGLPVGIQIVGPVGSESRLLGMAALYEHVALGDHQARLAELRARVADPVMTANGPGMR
jgi:aspartyl-tRNA(Asn)/glutamyl-tRNA(Gln) amidotransferase subunit A